MSDLTEFEWCVIEPPRGVRRVRWRPALVGAIALSLSTEFVLDLLSLPDWIEAIARWQWP